MKVLENFSAFKMEKKQMNAVKGGVTCVLQLADGTTMTILSVHPDISASEAADIVWETYKDLLGATQVICS